MTTATGAVRTWLAGLRPPRERGSLLRDALLWAVLVTPVLAQAGVRAVADMPWWPQVLGAAALVPAVRVSRSSPVLALVVSVALALVGPSFVWAPPVMSYLVGRRATGFRLPAAAFTAILVAGSVLAALNVVSWVYLVVGFAFLAVTPWLLGRYRRQYVALIHAGWERAEHLEREQRIIAEQARLRERARISRDMHDSLGHELSLIALQAGSLELASGLDDDGCTTAGELRRRAGAATGQLREIIGVLREDADTPSTEPRSQSIGDLVRRCRDAGMVVTVHAEDTEGEAPPMADRAVFRVVQEALTNAAKHAPGEEVAVRVRRSGGQTTVSVVNATPRQAGGCRTTGGPEGTGGQGLFGLQERARLLGGTVTTSSREGRFELTARLPHGSGRSPAGVAPAPGTPQTESTRQRAHADREVRRSLIVAVTGSALMAALILTVQVVVWIHNAERSYLSPARFGRVVVGQERARVAELLPPEQIPARPAERPEPPVPDRAVCEYYSGESNAFGTGPAYRLCFTGGRLVSKDVLLAEEGDGA